MANRARDLCLIARKELGCKDGNSLSNNKSDSDEEGEGDIEDCLITKEGKDGEADNVEFRFVSENVFELEDLFMLMTM